jgi:hypothetical protein
LYTVTINSVLRVYSPVLDDPSWFQLHLTLDGRSFAKTQKSAVSVKGSIWPLEARAVRAALLEAITDDKAGYSAELIKKLQAAEAEEGDMVLWLGADGAVGIRSILVRAAYDAADAEHGPQAANAAQVAADRKRSVCSIT